LEWSEESFLPLEVNVGPPSAAEPQPMEKKVLTSEAQDVRKNPQDFLISFD